MNESQTQAAEKAFLDFTRQVACKDSKGFISEGEHGKIFSFETYLREAGQPADVIAAWCAMAAKDNFLLKTSEKAKRSAWFTYVKVFFQVLALAIAVSLVLYLLVATLLLIVGVSLWNWKGFMYSIAVGTVLLPAYLITQYRKKKRKVKEAGNKEMPLFVIKYSDSDELRFARAKSRLFVKKDQK
jgi:hypothetical protein